MPTTPDGGRNPLEVSTRAAARALQLNGVQQVGKLVEVGLIRPIKTGLDAEDVLRVRDRRWITAETLAAWPPHSVLVVHVGLRKDVDPHLEADGRRWIGQGRLQPDGSADPAVDVDEQAAAVGGWWRVAQERRHQVRVLLPVLGTAVADVWEVELTADGRARLDVDSRRFVRYSVRRAATSSTALAQRAIGSFAGTRWPSRPGALVVQTGAGGAA